MNNLSLGTACQTTSTSTASTNLASAGQTTKTHTTLHRKAKSKKEIVISAEQHREARWLFKQYDMQVPGWLRRRFFVNQRRRKLLNDVLWDATLDRDYCGHSKITDDWSFMLHDVWHKVNEVPPC